MPATKRTKTHLELTLSSPSAVARASFDRPGGTHGKVGKHANRNDRRTTKQDLRQGKWS